MYKKAMLLLVLAAAVLAAACGAPAASESDLQTGGNMWVDEYLDVYGTIEVRKTTDYAIDFSAAVTDIFVAENQKVEYGEAILKLDLTEYHNQISTSEAKKQNYVSNLEQGIRSASSERDYALARLRGEIAALKNTYALAQERLDNVFSLFINGAVPFEEYNSLYTEVANLKVDLNRAESSLNSQARLFETQISALQAELSTSGSADKEIEIMKEKLNKSFIEGDTLVSDMHNGLVTGISCNPGEIIYSPVKLFSIADLDTVYARIEVPEDSAGDVSIGDTVEITQVSDKSAVFSGRVTNIGSRIVEINGSAYVIAEASFDAAGQTVRLGGNIDVRIFTYKEEGI
ncbi:MAG: efflux RND transporter periplasmic adaptor subunit [Clostridiales bacterium]|nr:efflux RND transporter periplasmic adaptor subunit [Clostridiales bacterium]